MRVLAALHNPDIIVAVAKYLVLVFGTIGSTSYIVGKKMEKIDEMIKWRDHHDEQFEELKNIVYYLRGRVNGSASQLKP